MLNTYTIRLIGIDSSLPVMIGIVVTYVTRCFNSLTRSIIFSFNFTYNLLKQVSIGLGNLFVYQCLT